ncbi:MAG: terminase small subunit [bacterium]
MSMKLTSKQKRFCEEYVIDLNGTQSAIRAGYSENSAYSIAEENLKKPEIEKYISGLQAEIRERNNIKADDVITDIVKIKEQCMQVKPIIIYDKAGNAKEIKSFNANAALKACELLGRYTGIFKEDNGQKNITIRPMHV